MEMRDKWDKLYKRVKKDVRHLQKRECVTNRSNTEQTMHSRTSQKCSEFSKPIIPYHQFWIKSNKVMEIDVQCTCIENSWRLLIAWPFPRRVWYLWWRNHREYRKRGLIINSEKWNRCKQKWYNYWPQCEYGAPDILSI